MESITRTKEIVLNAVQTTKQIVQHVKDVVEGKVEWSTSKRSSKWPKVRNKFLETNPVCVLCGGNKHLNVHHVKPFNERPDLELEPTNLITLCEAKKKGVHCHLLFGHFGNYRKINPDVREDCKVWSKRLASKPK